ncbi:MAG: GntR family transcriptional regulator [Acetatifactor sp.]|nr:GntR family transcriptional regulator [Acetatifactor sp.]
MKLSQNSSIPIYQQIADAMRKEIINGTYREGEYLPSIRGLAKDLKISVITTMKAYELLEQEGYVTASQGKGFYVNSQDTELLQEQHLRKVEDNLTAAIQEASIAGLSRDELLQMFNTLYDIKED